MTGFRSETEAGVKSAFSGVGKIIGAAVAIGGAVDVGKQIVEAATAHQSAFAVLDKTLTNAGAANRIYGQSVEGLLEKESRLKGFSDEQLAQAFVRLVSVTHDTGKAFKDLQEVEDVSRARHLDLATAALQVSKAEQGSVASLARVGIIVPKVSTAVDELRHRHDLAVASGAKFTAVQKEQYQGALAAAQAADKQARAELALNLIQQRFGGSAAKFADTASGQFARLHSIVHQFAVSIGTEVLPALAGGAETIGRWVTTLKQSGSVQDAVASGLGTLSTAYHSVAAVVETIGPPLGRVAAGIAQVVSSIGGAPILAAAATFKGLGLAVGAVSLVEKEYAKVVAAGAGATAAKTTAEAAAATATAENTAAIVANTEALLANSTASGAAARSLYVYEAGEVRLVAVSEAATVAVTEETAALAAQGIAAVGLGARIGALGAGLSALAFSPTGILIGIAAVAGGLTYLLTRTDAVTKAEHGLKSAIDAVHSAMRALPTDRLSVDQARYNVELARASLEQTKAAKGSLAYRGLVLSLRQAQDELRQALGRVTDDTASYTAGLQGAASAVSTVIDKYTKGLATLSGDTRRRVLGEQSRDLDNLAASNAKASPLLAHNITLLREFTETIDASPNKHEVAVILNNKDAKASLADLLAYIRSGILDFKKAGSDSGDFFVSGFRDAIAQLRSNLAAGVFPDLLAGVKRAAEAQAADDARRAVSERQKIVESVYAAHKDTIDQLNQELADAIQSGAQAVQAAAVQAEQNLTSIGASIAGMIGQLIDASPVGQEIKRLQGILDQRTESDQLKQIKASIASTEKDSKASIAAAEKALAQKKAAVPAGPYSPEQQRDIDLFLKPERDALNKLKEQRRQQLASLRQQLRDTVAQNRISDLSKGLADAKTTAAREVQDIVYLYQKGELAHRRMFTLAGANVGLVAAGNLDLLHRKIAHVGDAIATVRSITVGVGKQFLLLPTIINGKALTGTFEQMTKKALAHYRSTGENLGTFASEKAADTYAERLHQQQARFYANPKLTGAGLLKKEIVDVLTSAGVSFAAVSAKLGPAFAGSLNAEIAGLVKQANAISAGPRAAGGGLGPTIVKPLDAIHASQKQIEQVRHRQHQETNKILKEISGKLQADKFTRTVRPTGGKTAATQATELAVGGGG